MPSIKSLLKNSDVDEIYLLIEDDKFPYPLPKIKVINVSDQKFFLPGSPNYFSHFTYMAMMRATLCKYIKTDRCLSLDCDVFIDGDISELWELPPDDYYFAGGKEPDKSAGGDLYVNMGVIMFNLKKLRDGMADKVIEALNRKIYGFLEQDALNEYCRGKIYEFDPKYNVHKWSVPTEKPVVVHFAGLADWSDMDIYQKYDALEVTKNAK